MPFEPHQSPEGMYWPSDLGLCSPDWTRTSNRPINSRMLCQLSYGGPAVPMAAALDQNSPDPVAIRIRCARPLFRHESVLRESDGRLRSQSDLTARTRRE